MPAHATRAKRRIVRAPAPGHLRAVVGEQALLIVENAFSEEEVAQLRAALAGVSFVDGRVSAEGKAQDVKQNKQAQSDDAALRPVRQQVKGKLARHPTLVAYARPVRWSLVTFSRYEAGDAYGEHVDAPFRQADDGAEMRSDLSFTLFLSDPASYAGGELVMHGHARPEAVKLPAGSLVLYKTSVLHRVAPVREGVREAAVGWIESRYKSAEQRELLFDLEQSITLLTPDAPARRKLTLVFANLLKMWS